MTILLRNGGDISIRVYLAFRFVKREIVRSIDLANTRENGNRRAIIYTKGILQCTAVENAKELANVISNARDL